MLDAIKDLRFKTNAGMMDCKKALEESNGDIEKAIEILRKKGIAKAAKKTGRTTNQGIIETYVHLGGRIGVMVELNCETDFVARNEEFKKFAKEITLQVAAANPSYVSKEDVPEEVINKEKEILSTQVKDKPENVVEKIVNGRLDKFFSEVCLLEQASIKDPSLKIKDMLTSLVAKLGENIVIKRFERFEIGEDS